MFFEINKISFIIRASPYASLFSNGSIGACSNEKDKESNYADHGVRKYDDEIGRFTSIDPLWEKYYSLTPYQYAGNNPVIAKDADGRETSFTTLFEPVNKSNYPSNAQPLTMPDIVNNSDKPGNQKLIDNLKEIGIIGLANVAGDAIVATEKVGNWLKSIFGGGKEGSSRIQAGDIKEFKKLVQELSKPGSELTKKELQQLEKLTEKFGGKLRYDLNPVKGKIKKPHVQVEGLGSSVESRHIWLGGEIK